MAHDTVKLRELLARVEAATGPDRRLAGDLLHYFCKDGEGMKRMFGTLDVPDLTASLDASTALVERMLPGWEKELYIAPAGYADVDLRGPEFCDADMRQWARSGVHKTPPLALLSALLRALISQAEGEAQHG